MSNNPTNRILVVDDDPACRRMMRKLLELADYEVIEAEDGLAAYRRILSDQPAMIVTDWCMPCMDGLELIRKLRSTSLNWYPYVILVTANEDQGQGLDTGADDYVMKPVKSKELLPRIRAGERILQLQNTLREKNERLGQVNQELSRLAVTDPLTGLLNRRAFLDQAMKEWSRSSRDNSPLSCVILDIDHFKKINDTFGHPAGDDVIRAVADCLKKSFRQHDVICRYGGEEYCLLLTNCEADIAIQLSERLRMAITKLRVRDLGPDYEISVSCGVATRTLENLTIDSLLDQADQALLMAKRTGRNRVYRYEDIEHACSLMDAPPQLDDSRGVITAVVPLQVVNTLLTALDFRDPGTVVHSRRVAQKCRQFSQYLGLEPADRAMLEIAALLHDVGKLAIPDAILNKTGRLTEDEFAIAQQHRDVSVQILNSCFSNKELVRTVQLSDRYFDGSHGAPAGKDIPLGARILAIVSFFDDVVHGRAWWKAHTAQEALEIIAKKSGTQFDPDLVGAFSEMPLLKATSDGLLSRSDSDLRPQPGSQSSITADAEDAQPLPG